MMLSTTPLRRLVLLMAIVLAYAGLLMLLAHAYGRIDRVEALLRQAHARENGYADVLGTCLDTLEAKAK